MAKKPVWHSESKGTAREAFVAFSAGRDVVSVPEADAALVPYDCWTNRAHALGLHKIGVFTRPELKKILKALDSLESKWSSREWELDPSLEDVHINIEEFVTEHAGERIGGRLHTGRSRNDQVATDMKLFLRDAALHFCGELHSLAETLIESAKRYSDCVMPGYTHHRKATITTFGHWCAAYAQGVMRDAGRIQDLYARVNVCPLGAAASYGTTWPLDRAYAAELLAFSAVQENTLDAIDSRGEAEAEFVQALALSMKRLSALSQGLILFSTDEFGFIRLPSDFTTGSSIMPQKRNPDFAEAIKGKTSAVFGYAASLLSVNAGNFFGYNKDVQWTKYLFFDAVRETQGAALILAETLAGVEILAERMAASAAKGFLNAVDLADGLARERGLPFRRTYKLISELVGKSKGDGFTMSQLNAVLNAIGYDPLSVDEFQNMSDPIACVTMRDHAGSPHPKQVKRHCRKLARQNESLRKWIDAHAEAIEAAKKRCANGDGA